MDIAYKITVFIVLGYKKDPQPHTNAIVRDESRRGTTLIHCEVYSQPHWPEKATLITEMIRLYLL